jgi:hypothetical protein
MNLLWGFDGVKRVERCFDLAPASLFCGLPRQASYLPILDA